MSSLSALTALSSIGGRYTAKADPLRERLSEVALMRNRVKMEVHWLIALSQAGLAEVPCPSATAEGILLALVENFAEADAVRTKEIGAIINHDVKAAGHWTKERVCGNVELEAAGEFIHFACTSEDINSTPHGMMLKGARDTVIVSTLRRVQARLVELACTNADMSMLSHTYGQPASPTALGKEMANVVARLDRAIRRIEAVKLLGKMNGAVGNYNAHLLAYPSLGWEAFSKNVIETRLGLTLNPYTIQIEPHNYMAELSDAVARANTIILDLDRDIWGYISQGCFKQKTKAGEIGSSTMSHKVNSADSENSEGNAGLANVVLRHLLEKLPMSYWQRNLTDPTVLRNIGVAFGHSLLAYDVCLRGLGKLGTNPVCLAEDLDACWEVLAEPVQTVVRRYGTVNLYEQLKEPMRGRGISCETLREFIGTLVISEDVRKLLLDMTPASHIGKAEELVRRIVRLLQKFGGAF